MKEKFVQKVLPLCPSFLVWLGVGLCFLPLLHMDSGFGNVIYLSSAKMVFSGTQVSQGVELDFSVNIYLLVCLMVAILGGFSMLLGRYSPKNYWIGAAMALVGLVALFVSPFFVSLANPGITSDGLVYSFGFYFGGFFFLASIGLSIAVYFLKKK